MADIKFNEEKRDELRKAYEDALRNKKETFMFEGREMVTAYAKYLLEYLDLEFGPANANGGLSATPFR